MVIDNAVTEPPLDSTESERELRERELRERDLRERDLRERELRDRELDLRERDLILRGGGDREYRGERGGGDYMKGDNLVPSVELREREGLLAAAGRDGPYNEPPFGGKPSFYDIPRRPDAPPHQRDPPYASEGHEMARGGSGLVMTSRDASGGETRHGTGDPKPLPPLPLDPHMLRREEDRDRDRPLLLEPRDVTRITELADAREREELTVPRKDSSPEHRSPVMQPRVEDRVSEPFSRPQEPRPHEPRSPLVLQKRADMMETMDQKEAPRAILQMAERVNRDDHHQMASRPGVPNFPPGGRGPIPPLLHPVPGRPPINPNLPFADPYPPRHSDGLPPPPPLHPSQQHDDPHSFSSNRATEQPFRDEREEREFRLREAERREREFREEREFRLRE